MSCKQIKTKSKSKKNKNDNDNCCITTMNECNFSSVSGVISFATGFPILTMSGLNGNNNNNINICCSNEKKRSICQTFSSPNKFQINSVSATIGSVSTPIPIVIINQNFGGQLIAQLSSDVSGFQGPGIPFSILITNPELNCSTHINGTTI